MNSAPPSENQETVSGKEVLSFCSAIALMIAIMVASYYYPYPSGKRPELLSLLMLWGREAILLTCILFSFVVGAIMVAVRSIIDRVRDRRARRLVHTLDIKNRPAFCQPEDLWGNDGSLRDVYVQGVTEDDWAGLLALAKEQQHQYFFAGQERPLPDVQTIFCDRSGAHLLRIFVDKVAINCHFFVSTEIELDIDPKQVQTPENHLAVLAFLERLSAATMKNLAITAENLPESAYLSFAPKTMQWVIHEQRFGH